MARINLDSGDAPQVHVERVAGSLQVKGWDEEGIRIDVQDEKDLKYTFKNDLLVLTSQGDCILRIPQDSSLDIESVGGNAFIGDVEGELNLQSISGSLSVKNVGETSIGTVSGNLSIRSVEGDLSVESVHGNASIRDIEGSVNATDVHANLSLRDIEGEIVAHSRGNADLRVEPEAEVSVKAQGNLFCRVEDDADIDVTLHSGGNHIQLYTDDGRQLLNNENYAFKLGDGGTEVNLYADGHIDFRSSGKAGDFGFDVDLDFVDDMAGLADEISEQVTSQMEAQLENLNEQLESLGERLRNTGDKAARNAQRHVHAAQRRLEQRLAMQRGRIRGKHGHIVNMAPGIKRSEPVSSAERALILQMVQEKKINVQEAEMLLNTLEGRAVAEPPAAPEAPTAPTAPAAESHEDGENA